MPGYVGTMNDIYFYGGNTSANRTGSCPPIGNILNSTGSIHLAPGMRIVNNSLDNYGRLTNNNIAYVEIKPEANAGPAYTVNTNYDSSLGTVTTSVPMARLGDMFTVTATPNLDCYLVDLTVTDSLGAVIPANNDGTYTMPSSSVTVNAVFHSIYYGITVKTVGSGTVTVPTTAIMSSTVTPTVTPAPGWIFSSLTVADSNNQNVEVRENNQFTMPADDVTVTAEFEAQQQTLRASLYGSQYGSYSVSVNGSNPTTVSSEGNITIPGVNTGDSITVTFNPEDNGRIYEFYLEDAEHHEHHHESDILNNSYTFNMPSEETKIFTRFADATKTESVSYIDETGTGQTAVAIVLTGSEPVDYSNTRVILGEDPLENPSGNMWYVVKSNLNYADVDLYLKGHVHLIVADGATITVQGGIAYNYLDGDAVLSLYGQTNGTGKLVSDSFSAAQLNVCGAEYEAKNITGRVNVQNGSLTVSEKVKCTDVNISGGRTTVNGNVECSKLTITSGVTKITGTAYAEESITLGCSNSSDSITIAELTKHANALTSIVEGQTLTDGVREYSGNDIAGSDLEAMAGKTLVRDQEHNAENMTRHAAVDPTFDAETGSYNNGNVEYYTCPTCNGVFVQDGNAFVRKTENEVITPYFRFKTTGIEGYKLCEVIGYNGMDADVIIPDTVPANYPDENQRGNTVTGIDHYAFKDKTFVTSVTAGNYLRGIYGSAFEGCTSLKTVTVGSSLDSIGIDAFKGCTALESFTSTSLKDNISCSYFEGEDDPDEPRPAEYSFDPDTTVTFYGPHGSSLRYIPNNYTNSSFVPTDRHVDPTWTWAEDYSSATAVFNCSNTCKLNGGDNAKFTDENIDLKVTDDGAYFTASVVVDGETYTAESPCTKPSFKRQSLTLDGKIGVNFFMDLPAISDVWTTQTAS